MSSSPSVLLFDLGGVLVDFSGQEDLRAILPTPIDEATLLDKWAGCRHSLAYGTGALATGDFLPLFMHDWGLTMPPEAFLETWQSWVHGWLPGAADLLDLLRPRYRLAALSNSNPAHWERLGEHGVLDAFDTAIGSHQIGVRKPDPASYRLTLERLGAGAGDVLFFDDSRDNVEAARRAGLRAAHAQGPEAVRRHLVDAGLL